MSIPSKGVEHEDFYLIVIQYFINSFHHLVYITYYLLISKSQNSKSYFGKPQSTIFITFNL